jgi:hypothetical protein
LTQPPSKKARVEEIEDSDDDAVGSAQTKTRKRAPSATLTQPPSKKAHVEEIEDDDAAGSGRSAKVSTDPGPGSLSISSRTKTKVIFANYHCKLRLI